MQEVERPYSIRSTDEHLERIMTLRRAGWNTHYLDYLNCFQDGWIDNDAPAVEALKENL